MSNTLTKKPQRKQTNLELSAPARGALRRLKTRHGVTKTFAVERGLVMLEQYLNAPQGRGL